LPKAVQIQDYHEKNGNLTEFAGFNLPLWFKGITREASAVRNAAGVFDVSHMGRVATEGRDSARLVDSITTNDVASLKIAQGQYSLICNPDGGIKDDITVFRLGEQEHLMVFNAGNRSKDYDWIVSHARGLDVSVRDISDDVAMFAIQGPKAREIVRGLSRNNLDDIPRFGWAWTELADAKALVTQTGYTGEDGFEIYVWDSPLSDPEKARLVWDRMLEAGKPYGLEPCGLGARDLLRLEAGLCLYGTDMDEYTNPYEAKLGFVVKLHKDFVGRQALQAIKEKGTQRVRVALVTVNRVIPRHGFGIASEGKLIGTVSSGTLSPLLNTGIAMGYVQRESAKEGGLVDIQVRERSEKAKIVKTPFYDTTRYGYSRKN
jgi:aminomethyltransferase